HNLTADSTPEQLRKHAPELNVQLHDWKARNKEQIEALVPDKRKEKLTIEERAKYCAKTGDKWDIFIHSRDIGPKSNDDKEIVASCSWLSLFHNELLKVGVACELIDTYAKDSNVTTASNKIQKKRTERDVANNQLKIPPYFSLEKGLKRIQNIDTTNDSSLQDLADIMMMLCMRPAENKEENNDNPEPRTFLVMEKNPERARTLLIWIQEAIKARKLGDPTFSENGKRNTRAFSEFLKPHKITPKILRKIGGKHACRVHGGPNPTHQHLDLLNRIVLRHKIVRLDARKNYAIDDTESEESDSKPETSDSSKPQIQASSSSQTIEMDLMLAEIDA
ncbi:17893_t:CDS:2, partial [Dentiscutata erythropus]